MTTTYNTFVDATGAITSQEAFEIPQQPLDSTGAFATLLVVKGVIGIDDASNALRLTPEDLTLEAEAWAVAAAGA